MKNLVLYAGTKMSGTAKKGNNINTPKSKQVSDERAQERELWFKTVVKVLSWKEKSASKKQSQMEKISDKEWASYCEQTLKINANTLKSKTMKKLEEVEELIRKHGGFA